MIGLGDSRTTIVAIASATSPSLRGIVRLAGDDAVDILQKIVDQPLAVTARPTRFATQLRLPLPLGTVAGVALVWPTKQSYTGCPTVEIHTFGSLPILEAIVVTLIDAGARPAGAGEFTMRAFLTGRLDLTQAEAVLGVIDATNRKQLDAALTQLAGNVAAPLREARDQLLNMLADLEAGLDFVEEDISFIDDESLYVGLNSIAQLIETIAKKMTANRRSESHHWVVLRGLPNAGKSSLLNALANQAVAIVSDQAGTTRDVVWKELSIGGYQVRIADTAGVDADGTQIMAESQRAAAEIQEAANVVIQCCDARQVLATPGDMHAYHRLSLRVATKGDTIDANQTAEILRKGWIITSAVSGAGLTILCEAIVNLLAASPDANDAGVPGTAARCGDVIQRAANSLHAARNLVVAAAGQELIAVEMRQALAAIGEVTGEIYTDDILDRVFSRFCIGK